MKSNDNVFGALTFFVLTLLLWNWKKSKGVRRAVWFECTALVKRSYILRVVSVTSH